MLFILKSSVVSVLTLQRCSQVTKPVVPKVVAAQEQLPEEGAPPQRCSQVTSNSPDVVLKQVEHRKSAVQLSAERWQGGAFHRPSLFLCKMSVSSVSFRSSA
jgi:hypothetical protein